MKIALYQAFPNDGDIEGGFSCVETSLAAAARAGAKMVVFPELFFPGYNRPDLHKNLAQPLGGVWTQRLSALAKKAGCGLTIGWAEQADGEVYNAATCFDHEGNQLAHYRKIQLFGPMERASFSPGSSYVTFDFEGQKAALLICYDVEFPQHCIALANLGVELVFVPTANPRGHEHVSQILVPARASEMGLVIVYANYCGSENGLSFAGQSLIAGPDARPLAAAGQEEKLLIADISREEASMRDVISTQREDYRRIEKVNDL